MLCRCGKPTHPSFGLRCPDCWADDNGHCATNVYKEKPRPSIISKEEALSLPICDLELSTRTTNRLCILGINFIRDLDKWTVDKLLNAGRLGDAALDEIIEGLQMFGLKLGP